MHTIQESHQLYNNKVSWPLAIAQIKKQGKRVPTCKIKKIQLEKGKYSKEKNKKKFQLEKQNIPTRTRLKRIESKITWEVT